MTRQCPKLAGIDRIDRLAKLGQEGRDWYAFANAQVKAGAVILDISERRFADLLAVFSPRVTVVRSVRFTVYYVKTGKYLPDVTRNVRASVKHYEATGEIRGPKTGPFADALMLDQDAIVLDTWMALAFKIDQGLLRSKYVETPCKRLIRRVAKRNGWTSAQAQAAIWTGTVIEAGRNPAQLFIEAELDNTPI